MKKTAITVQAPKCTICQKSVYDTEKIQAIDQVWHKTCFCCGARGRSGGCNKVLTLDKYLDHNGEPFCKTCHGRLFGPKGYGYGVGAGVLCPSEPITPSKVLVSDDIALGQETFEIRNKILSPREDEVDMNSSSKKLKSADVTMDLVSSTASSPRMQIDDNTLLRTSPRPAMETVTENDDDDDGIVVVDELVEENSIAPTVDESTAFVITPTVTSAAIDENKINQSITEVEIRSAIDVENNENRIVDFINNADQEQLTSPIVSTPAKKTTELSAPVSATFIGSSPRRDLSSILGINKDNSAVKMKLGGGAPKCAACQKSVFPAEKVQAIDQIWHVSEFQIIFLNTIFFPLITTSFCYCLT